VKFRDLDHSLVMALSDGDKTSRAAYVSFGPRIRTQSTCILSTVSLISTARLVPGCYCSSSVIEPGQGLQAVSATVTLLPYSCLESEQ
jgi:hypothetical protein